ncbi:MAG: 50S ribosomal protein L7/L12 [Candidatus Omnitrophica bacterium]|nr:50S ribosomal protein L7/L12 [Candidatus Omnitrophota bacterium]
MVEVKSEEVITEKSQEVLSDKSQNALNLIENMTVMELAKFIKALEDKFGVSPVMASVAAGPAAGAPGQAAQAVEKTTFDVVLTEVGANKIQVIKEVRAFTNLGLKEAKDLVDSAPKPIKQGASKEEAENIKAKIEAVGAKVELK